jgi:hypothetical protein
MIIHKCEQGSPEWHRLRALNFTASELGPFVFEPVKITLTVEEIKAELDAQGIIFKGITKRDDLLAKLPGKEAYAKLTGGARTAIISKIKSERVQEFLDKTKAANDAGHALPVTQEEDIFMLREEELASKKLNQFEYNIPVKWGKKLEPFARAYYQSKTGYEVNEVGFIEHGDGTSGFGCSPDGLIYHQVPVDCGGNVKVVDCVLSHGLELKCPIPETHMAWLDDGNLPDEHKLQVHCCMAVTGLDRWDFLSYCPGYRPHLVITYRNELTEQLESGLKTMVTEKYKFAEENARVDPCRV